MGQNSFQFSNPDRGSIVAANARVAGESRERRRGLLGTAIFEQGAGLWIVPCEAIHTFGMRLPIDSIFLNKGLRVTSLRIGLKPWRIAVCLRAHSVLELPAGTIAKSHTQVGDQLRKLANP